MVQNYFATHLAPVWQALRDETHRWFECKGTAGAEACP